MPTTYDLRALADVIGAEIQGDACCVVNRLNSLRDAVQGELAFLANSAYRKYLSTTGASAVILSRGDLDGFAGNALVVSDPYLAFAQLTRLFNQDGGFSAGVHATAVIDATATIHPTACVSEHVVVRSGADIHANVYLGAGTVIGDESVVGAGSYLHANVTIGHSVAIGKKCIIQSGAVIGSDGFGFAWDRDHWVKVYQLGGVEVGDNVEIGANTTVDRGTLGNTRIGDGVIIDNQVQIAHNVEIGDYSALAGCCAVSGSTKIGKHCMLAGGVGLVGHIELCDRVTVTAMSMITKSIDRPGVYSSGTPFQDSSQWKKNAIRFGQLDKIARRLSSLQKRNKNDL